MRRRHHRNRHSNTGYVFFGAGLLACTLLPTRMVVLLLALALVLCGCSCGN